MQVITHTNFSRISHVFVAACTRISLPRVQTCVIHVFVTRVKCVRHVCEL